MNTNINSILRQIKMHDADYLNFKNVSLRNKQTLTFFYREVLDWFFNNYSPDTEILFHASVKQGKRVSLWIEKRQIDLIKTYSSRHQVSDARVIYTAFILYLKYFHCELAEPA